MKIITFQDRYPMPKAVAVGMASDQNVEAVRFALPQIHGDQRSYVYLTIPTADGSRHDVVELVENQLVISGELAAIGGVIQGYAEIQDPDGVMLWHSDVFTLQVRELNNVTGEIEKEFPTALQQAMSQTAADRENAARSAQAAFESAETASDAVKTIVTAAAGVAENAKTSGQNAISAYQSMNAAAQSMQAAKTYESTAAGHMNSAAGAASAAAGSADAALTAQENAEDARDQANTAAGAADESAKAAAKSAEDAAKAVSGIGDASAAAVKAVQDQQTASVQAVATQQATSVTAVQQAGNTAVAQVEQVKTTIPADYTALSGSVTQLSRDMSELDYPDIKGARDEVGASKVWKDRIEYKYTGGTWRFIDKVIDTDEIHAGDVVTLIVTNAHLSNVTGGLLFYDGTFTNRQNSVYYSDGMYVLTAKYNGLGVRMQVSTADTPAADTYYADIRVVKGDMTKYHPQTTANEALEIAEYAKLHAEYFVNEKNVAITEQYHNSALSTNGWAGAASAEINRSVSTSIPIDGYGFVIIDKDLIPHQPSNASVVFYKSTGTLGPDHTVEYIGSVEKDKAYPVPHEATTMRITYNPNDMPTVTLETRTSVEELVDKAQKTADEAIALNGFVVSNEHFVPTPQYDTRPLITSGWVGSVGDAPEYATSNPIYLPQNAENVAFDRTIDKSGAYSVAAVFYRNSGTLGPDHVAGSIESIEKGVQYPIPDDAASIRVCYKIADIPTVKFSCKYDIMQELDKKADKPAMIDRYMRATGQLVAGGKIELADNDIKIGKHIAFYGKVTTAGKIRICNGYHAYGSAFVEVDGQTIRVVGYTTAESVKAEWNHGLTIKNDIAVLVDVPKDETSTVKVRVTSNGQTYENSTTGFDGGNGKIYVESVSAVMNTCTLSFTADGYNSNIHLYGDSYFGIRSVNSWIHNMLADGFTSALIDGFPGKGSTRALLTFKENIKHSTPKYAVWCLGMNNPDTDSAINTSWKIDTENFLAICDEKGITPVLATIPTARGGAVSDTSIASMRINKHKNAYVRNSGRRYIDFDTAVNASETDGSWYAGMLGDDGVHPTVAGGKELYARVLVDFPEIMMR